MLVFVDQSWDWTSPHGLVWTSLQKVEDGDEEILKWVLEFNKFDLYTKADKRPDVEKLWPYYQQLIDKYMPGKLSW